MQIIVPMSGYGRRFLSSGYTQPKYMLDVGYGKSVIESLVNTFPKGSDILFILNTNDYQNTSIVSALQALAPYAKVVQIEPHSDGPVKTLLDASVHIKPDQEVIVSYCDFVPVWDCQKMLANARNLSADCSVATYRGYHPHHKKDSDRYGYCRTIDNSMTMVEYREKDCFTQTPQQENASCGLYYFKNGSLLLEYSSLVLSSKKRINGEMYISMVAMEMIDNKLNVIVDDILYMLQLGTPKDYETVRYIITSITSLLHSASKQLDLVRGLPCVLPMAGRGSRFTDLGITTPKQFLPIFNTIACSLSLANLPISEIHIGVLPKHLTAANKLFPDASSLTVINQVLNGQALTCKEILMRTNIQGPFIITPCDSAISFNNNQLNNHLETSDWDILVMTCKPNPATSGNENSYSWVFYDSECNVKDVLCKQYPPSEYINKFMYGHIDGTFFFRSPSLYFDLISDLIKQGRQSHLSEYYVDELVKIAVEQGAKVFSVETSAYICFGTPDDYHQLCYYYNSLAALGALTK